MLMTCGRFVNRTLSLLLLLLCAVTLLKPARALEIGDTCKILDQPGICTNENECFKLEHLVNTKRIRNRQIPSCGISLYGEIVCCPNNMEELLKSLTATSSTINTVDIQPENRLKEQTTTITSILKPISTGNVGDACKILDQPGKCTNEDDCFELEHLVNTKRIRNRQIPRCGISLYGEIVCCPTNVDELLKSLGATTSTINAVIKPENRVTTKPNSAILNDKSGTVESDVRPAIKACREYEDIARSEGPAYLPHILGGVKADFGEYPHMGAIGFRSETFTPEGGGLEYNCGAALISRKFVLTAAHCLARTNLHPEVVRFNFTDFNDLQQEFIEIPINKSRIFAPENYRSNRIYDDIAVVELVSEVPISRYCRPICLATEQEPSEDQPVYATGWGITKTSKKILSNVLLKVGLKIQPLLKCNASYKTEITNRRINQGIIQTQICAYDPEEDPEKKGDSCTGDSGGPLVEVVNETFRIYRTIGVVSSGFSCGTNLAGLYTRVSAYLDFIEKIVWPQP